MARESPEVRAICRVLTVVTFAVLAVGYLVVLVKIPDWTNLKGSTDVPRDRHNARLLVVSVGGAVAVIVGLLYTSRSYRLTQRGQVTERFVKALERLGDDSIETRLGGIHALEHVARDFRAHHDDVIEVLEAFITTHTPRRHVPKAGWPPPALPWTPRADIRAALTALAHRPQRPERRILELRHRHLTGANLVGARLANVDLTDADLTNANFADANLSGTHFTQASLRGADLTGANLTGANLNHTDLRTADLTGADLLLGNLAHADLTRADLSGADLTGANLAGMDLTRTNLTRTDMTSANLTNAKLPPGCLAPVPPDPQPGEAVEEPPPPSFDG